MPTYLSKYFTLEESVATQVRNVDNTPGPQELSNLYRLAKATDPLRDSVGALHVNSGYRSPMVNHIVGGAANSYHTRGLAYDLTPLSPAMTLKKLVEAASMIMDYDQIIYEFGRWVHVGIAEAGAAPRKQLLMILAPRVYEPYNPDRIK